MSVEHPGGRASMRVLHEPAITQQTGALREAVVAVLCRDGRVLVIRRGPSTLMAGYWSLPSGRIEPGETQPDALTRELREELGVVASPIEKVWECPTDDGTFWLHWWTVSIAESQLELNEDEVAEAHWVTTEEFLELEPTFEGDRDFFRTVLPRIVECR